MDENRNEMRAQIKEWVKNKVWVDSEMYPFENTDTIQNEFRAIIEPMGAVWDGFKIRGEFIVLYAIWESEGVKFRCAVNPRNDGRCIAQFLFVQLGDGPIY